ncbi:MAG: dihydrolipoyl dehydrogenase family protein [Acidimicrobiales bacterium]
MRFVVIGGGPAGNRAATHAARLGVEVVLIERDIVGGAANLWDCIPSKAMIATGGAASALGRIAGMGVTDVHGTVDLDVVRSRISTIIGELERSNEGILASQEVEVVRGDGRLLDPHTVAVTTASGDRTFDADAVLLSTGSRPRVPEWASIDGVRILATRDAYPPDRLPDHLVVVGSGVTGVEFVHMFSSFGSEVTLIVSRQQVLPQKDPEVAAALEADFLGRGVTLFKGARAVSAEVSAGGVTVRCDDGREAQGSHALIAIGSIPNSEGLGLEEAGVVVDAAGYVPVNRHCQTNLPHVFAAGDLSGKLPLSSVALMQGQNVADYVVRGHTASHRHPNYDSAPSAIFTEPQIADVGLAEADAFAQGRKIRVTKVPFAASSRAVIDNDSRGFVKIITDPATGIVLGGSIVGRHASELISVIALAVTGRLHVADIVESMPVHPTLAEALAEAAE